MKIMYIAPRFHTNQVSVVKGWKQRGDEVIFLSYYTAIIEDYSVIKPVVLGFSPLYNLIDYLYVNVIHRKNPEAITFKIKHGFPPIWKLRHILKKEKPDIIVMRERSLYTMAAYLLCPKREEKCILYYQTPLWDKPRKTDWKHKLVYHMTPRMQMTPVIGTPGEGKVINENTFFVPFVVEPQVDPTHKKYFKNDQINILEIGKYETRKHHFMMIDVVAQIAKSSKDKLHLTIIGEATTRAQVAYFEDLEKYVKDHGFEDLVKLKKNVPRKETDAYYEQTDVFIIPSTREMASISQLEAMSFSIPVICSDKNGSECYVKDGECGYLFEDCNQEDLLKKTGKLLESRERIIQMGKAAYENVAQNYTFANYNEAFTEIIEKMKS